MGVLLELPEGFALSFGALAEYGTEFDPLDGARYQAALTKAFPSMYVIGFKHSTKGRKPVMRLSIGCANEDGFLEGSMRPIMLLTPLDRAEHD